MPNLAPILLGVILGALLSIGLFFPFYGLDELCRSTSPSQAVFEKAYYKHMGKIMAEEDYFEEIDAWNE